MTLNGINIKDFTYNLPENKIAKYPLSKREDSKLLVYDKGKISEKKFENIIEICKKNELLVFNNTKVIQARLNFKKETGANIEVFCLEPIEPADYSLMFQTTNSCKWKCIIGNLKKWKKGKISSTISSKKGTSIIYAKKIETTEDAHIIEFSWGNTNLTFGDIMETSGQTPIPPYLKRKSEDNDVIRYQTVYSKHKGSVAAPTAGLHFTNDILSKFTAKGIQIGNITLHVGAGTFKPVKSDYISEHEMHTEHFSVTIELLKQLINKIGNTTAIGTTTVRTLESLYFLGVKLMSNPNLNKFHIKQWEVYDLSSTISIENALQNIIDYLNEKKLSKIDASTQIIIVPGYKFKIVNKLITNFHQPKSTLLLLISAFIGSDWRKVYQFALENNFRFLSYGDSSILIP